MAKAPADLTLAEVARRLGMKTDECREKLPKLFARGFPRPDETTHRFDPEAVERWRRTRNESHARLFPEYSQPKLAKDASSVDVRARIAALV